LTLVEAQKQIHRLAPTDEQIDGIASWYGPYFQGRQTASGEQFEQQDFTAAHPSLPFDTYLKVTNQQNGKSVVVRINDRGPYFGNRNLDLSHAAAIALNSDEVGVVPITATILVVNN
ncbi:MAG: septal ring lytic transglycosylase RlpA family protein, partial [Pseudanabaena sp.]